ncbi:hypothetical protein FRC04_006899 [Tulasnella sp. 424]|nr:hypothetical protein FRC04_006899 [Tulasnella sp. 424]KAG8974405.1 hypothetical protein FRC05_007566 [Tulasnella sp. 425]
MHYFWTVPELLAEVLDYLGDRDRRVMAQICQTFWLPAARLSWRDIPQFSYLLRLFPEERQIIYRVPGTAEFVALSGTLRTAEWRRFRLFAPFVRTLQITIDENNYKTLLRLHNYSKGTVLLPNLDTITLEVQFTPLLKQESAQICELFLLPSIKMVEYRHSGPYWVAEEQMILSVFDRLQAIPHLENLHWSGRAISDEAQRSLCLFLSSAPHLGSICLVANNLPYTVLLSASHIPTLTTASLSNLQDIRSVPPAHAVFASLTDLEYAGTNAGLHGSIRTIKAPRLIRLCVSMSNPSGYGPNPFETLKDSERFPALVDLRVKNFHRGHLEAIFSLRSLRILHIEPAVDLQRTRYWPVRIIRLFARSFPKLEDLVLGDGYPDGDVSLPDLAYFATFCPQLRQLSMSVDAREMHTFSGNLTPHPTLEMVNLGQSEADGHEIEIAEAIHRLWPRLQECYTIWEDPRYLQTTRWARIRKDVKTFQKMQALDGKS